MSISFTGIKDCRVFKKEYERNGIYEDSEGVFRKGPKRYNETMITARLTDDKDGNHLSEYLSSMPEGYENTQGKDLVMVHVTRMKPVDTDEGLYLPNLRYSIEPQEMLKVELNDKIFNMNRDEDMSMASFLAHMTGRDLDKTGMNERQQECAKVINKAIEEKVYEFLDIDV